MVYFRHNEVKITYAYRTYTLSEKNNVGLYVHCTVAACPVQHCAASISCVILARLPH